LLKFIKWVEVEKWGSTNKKNRALVGKILCKPSTQIAESSREHPMPK